MEKKNLSNSEVDTYSEKKDVEDIEKILLSILEDYSVEKKKIEMINTDLISANKELEQFVYIASHDLQEPLRTISNYVELINKKYSGKIDEVADQYLHFIVTATLRMQNLIKDLMDYMIIGRNITFVEVDYNEVLKKIIAEMDDLINESNAKITSSILPVLRGNKIELKRLFQHLISNAIKFRKKSVASEIAITVEEKGIEYLFAIKDNGIGIEEQFINKLFVVFKRLHNVAEYPGTGIGLAACKKIVALFGGKIWVESKLGEGSTFYFTIAKGPPYRANASKFERLY